MSVTRYERNDKDKRKIKALEENVERLRQSATMSEEAIEALIMNSFTEEEW